MALIFRLWEQATAFGKRPILNVALNPSVVAFPQSQRNFFPCRVQLPSKKGPRASTFRLVDQLFSSENNSGHRPWAATSNSAR